MTTIQYYRGDRRQEKESKEKKLHRHGGKTRVQRKRLKKKIRSTLMASWTRRAAL